MPTMTQNPTWAATLAPIGKAGITGQIIDPECVITVRDGAPLFAPDGSPIGRVTGVSVVDGYIVATGTIDHDRNLLDVLVDAIPDVLPTFDVGANDRRTFGPVNDDGTHCGTVTFHTMEIGAVRAGYEPAWTDSEIMFSEDWCVHVLGPDDLIAMPDYATAARSARRFNAWWHKYRTQREEDGVDLPETPAIVRPWPYDTGHPAALAELQANDPEGWLSD